MACTRMPAMYRFVNAPSFGAERGGTSAVGVCNRPRFDRRCWLAGRQEAIDPLSSGGAICLPLARPKWDLLT